MTLKVTLKAVASIPLDLSFEVSEAELIAPVGPSGSGKTTTPRTIAGFWQPDTARVEIAGSAWLDTARNISVTPPSQACGTRVTGLRAVPAHDGGRRCDRRYGRSARTRACGGGGASVATRPSRRSRAPSPGGLVRRTEAACGTGPGAGAAAGGAPAG
ncbi:MAG TPA: ATP-binding cassette domain-containing protein, partial [Rhodovulum sp.]|nr:ATP-binding cassette domain-containing protein [Rhodovulum sp.]